MAEAYFSAAQAALRAPEFPSTMADAHAALRLLCTRSAADQGGALCLPSELAQRLAAELLLVKFPHHSLNLVRPLCPIGVHLRQRCTQKHPPAPDGPCLVVSP